MDAEPEGENGYIASATQINYSEDDIIQGIESIRTTDREGNLKPLTTEELRMNIHEFYLVILGGKFVGCFRIFQPESLNPHRALELGSVVSTKRGVGGLIADQAKLIAIEQRLPIIAVTQGRFVKILKNRGWKIRKRKYKKRCLESCSSKVLLEFKP